MPGGYHENLIPWKDDDALKLLKMIDKLGTKWKQIGDILGRSQNSVRNKFQRIQKGAYMTSSIQKCRKCGARRKGHICQENVSQGLLEAFPFDPCYYHVPSEDELLDTDTILDMYESCLGKLKSCDIGDPPCTR